MSNYIEESLRDDIISHVSLGTANDEWELAAIWLYIIHGVEPMDYEILTEIERRRLDT